MQRHLALTTTIILPKDSESVNLDATVDLNNFFMKAKKANSVAMCLLTISVTDIISYNSVYNSGTSDTEGGIAPVAWQILHDIDIPMSITKCIELESIFNKCGLYKDKKIQMRGLQI